MQPLTKRKQILLLIVAIIMTAATIAFAVAFGVTYAEQRKDGTSLNNIFEKSYYETSDALKNVRTDLKKAAVLDSRPLREQLLLDVWNNCTIASDNLTQLSGQSEKIPELIKMLNQIGDYSRYLSKKTDEEGLSESESENLNVFVSAIEKISTSLNEVSEQLIKGDKIQADILRDLDNLTENLSTIDYSSINYPELIYDGPFSDGLSDRTPKALENADEISKERAQELVSEYFEGAEDIELIAESETTLAAYMFSFSIDGNEGNISITKKGGKVLLYNSYKEINNPQLDDQECIEKATEYIQQMGYENMKPVWISNNNTTVYVNFAFEKNGIVYYPDLIKIKLSGEDGVLLGVEAQNYMYNHTDRTLENPGEPENISINASLTVKSKQLCVIPTDWNTEILCLEVVAEKADETYYIYYNVETGNAERIMIVIDDDGQLLI